MREILGLGWAQQSPTVAPCPVALTLGGVRASVELHRTSDDEGLRARNFGPNPEYPPVGLGQK